MWITPRSNENARSSVGAGSAPSSFLASGGRLTPLRPAIQSKGFFMRGGAHPLVFRRRGGRSSGARSSLPPSVRAWVGLAPRPSFGGASLRPLSLGRLGARSALRGLRSPLRYLAYAPQRPRSLRAKKPSARLKERATKNKRREQCEKTAAPLRKGLPAQC